MKRKLSFFIDNSMSCVAATLIANDHVIQLCQQINHSSLAFIAPVNTDNHTVAHWSASSFFSSLLMISR